MQEYFYTQKYNIVPSERRDRPLCKNHCRQWSAMGHTIQSEEERFPRCLVSVLWSPSFMHLDFRKAGRWAWTSVQEEMCLCNYQALPSSQNPMKPQNTWQSSSGGEPAEMGYCGCCNGKAYSSGTSSRAKKVSQTFQTLKGTTPIIHVSSARKDLGWRGVTGIPQAYINKG